jgi:hypothetical protein
MQSYMKIFNLRAFNTFFVLQCGFYVSHGDFFAVCEINKI